jgi:flagellar motor switch protein FliG
MMNARSTNLPSGGIRKAAILVASLEQAAADTLLDQMGPERAARVRQAMVDLGDVDPGEQQRVIEEFFRVRPMMPQEHPPGIELDGRPFQFLQETAADKLARALSGERAQTIALVLSHLPPEQAGSVLARLPASQQVEVIRRLVDLEETDAEILREVERGLQARLSQQVQMQRNRVAGLPAVDGILKACDTQVVVQILDNLAAYDQPLAERLSPPALTFDDLAELDGAALGALLQAAPPALLDIALVGARPSLIERFLSRLAPAQALNRRHQLDRPGPMRLSDVEVARQRLVDLARHLAAAGRIRLPARLNLETATL